MNVAPTRAAVVHHDSPSGRWTLATRASAPALHPCVPAYVGYEECSRQPLSRLEVPHPNITVIINLGAPLAVHAPALERPGATYRSFAAGLYDTVAMTRNTGDSAGIELNLTPLGMWQLLGVPMHELANRAVELETLFGRSLRPLIDALLNTPSWDGRFDMLDAALTARLARSARPPAPVRWAWTELQRAPRETSVDAIARELQWSRRRLVAAFREHVGMTPKMFSRVVRFDRAVRRVRGGSRVRWSAIALECGYADQAHLCREFAEFAGMTPTDFLARQGALGLAAD